MFSAQSGTKQKTSKEELFGYPMRGTKMKLNYKRTIFVGFAFFLHILAGVRHDNP